MLIIFIFFIAHWFGSLFFQTFFQRRCASHRMFTTSKGWERVFYLLAHLFEGASFLNPRAYAPIHRAHHAYSDTEQDPHSPHYFFDVLPGHLPGMAADRPHGFTDTFAPPVRRGLHPMLYFLCCALVVIPAIAYPVMMGPIHRAIVNRCGYKYGYRNFDNNDKSKNITPFDFLMLGELFQNNHHKHPNSANFGKRWFEIDPVIKAMHRCGSSNREKLIKQ